METIQDIIAANCKETLSIIAVENAKIRESDFATEGVIKGVASDIWRNGVMDPGSEIKGWFEGVATKQRHINEFADETIQWLKDKDNENKGLDLDMGSFKTWLKTSETMYWRYYFVLNDKMYNQLVAELKKSDTTKIEGMVDFDMKERTETTRLLDNARTIKDLIVLVNKYKARVNMIFELIGKRKRAVKGAPFQVMLLGMVDLNKTVRKIVYLAE